MSAYDPSAPRLLGGRVIRIAALVAMVVGFTACQDTGDSRCARFLDAVVIIDSQGYDLDCTGRQVNPCNPKGIGCTIPSTRQVLIYPNIIPVYAGDAYMHRVLLHEAGHTLGYWDEWKAELYAFCHMTPTERRAMNSWVVNPANPRWPIPSDCWQVV